MSIARVAAASIFPTASVPKELVVPSTSATDDDADGDESEEPGEPSDVEVSVGQYAINFDGLAGTTKLVCSCALMKCFQLELLATFSSSTRILSRATEPSALSWTLRLHIRRRTRDWDSVCPHDDAKSLMKRFIKAGADVLRRLSECPLPNLKPALSTAHGRENS